MVVKLFWSTLSIDMSIHSRPASARVPAFPGQSYTVGGQRALWAGTQTGRCCDYLFEVPGQERLTTGEPDVGDVEPGDRDAREPGKLVSLRQLLAS
ncbi:hypothetical protein A8144_06490 [Mycobacterium leprae 3125609]|nr:hypothetical protein A8144_06490 [Mycobacterium leprae 3125609]